MIGLEIKLNLCSGVRKDLTDDNPIRINKQEDHLMKIDLS